MSVRKVAVIGGGQLGSRHLQALGRLEQACEIFLVDPSATSLAIAKERFAAISSDDFHTLHALPGLDSLPSSLDLVIVATPANVRLSVIAEVLQRSTVNYWILEKVLFQSLEDYPAALGLLARQKERVWVNCAQRLWPFFLDLKARFGSDPKLRIDVVGSNWGLGSNCVHNADIAAFLWDGSLRHSATLDPQMLDSKRPGFKEFTGEIETSVSGGGVVRQLSYASGIAPFSFIVTHPSAQLIWNVGAGILRECGEQSNWVWEERSLEAPFQSVLTTHVVAEIFLRGCCALPNLESASATHVGVLKAIIAAAKANGLDLGKICPVT